MDRIGLADAITALRAELVEAIERSNKEDLTFPVQGVQIELQVGVTRHDRGRGGLRFWVVELGAETAIVDEQVQRITLQLGPPRHRGETIAVGRNLPTPP